MFLHFWCAIHVQVVKNPEVHEKKQTFETKLKIRLAELMLARNCFIGWADCRVVGKQENMIREGKVKEIMRNEVYVNTNRWGRYCL